MILKLFLLQVLVSIFSTGLLYFFLKIFGLISYFNMYLKTNIFEMVVEFTINIFFKTTLGFSSEEKRVNTHSVIEKKN